jgi:glucokinase
MADHRRWILADASTAGSVRFGWTTPGARKIESVRAMSSERHPTFTDALLTYEREEGIPLRGSEFVLAAAAPPAGDAIPIARSRWTISRSGLSAMFGGSVAIMNDVAATAWSLLGSAAGKLEPLTGPRSPDFTKPGRWVIILLDEGVNAASLEIGEDGRSIVVDGEAGNAGFSPSDENEIALMRKLRVQRPHVSWESALTAGWQEQHAASAEREAWAAMAGSFVGDVILQLGAWNGAILTGRHIVNLRDPLRLQRFTQRLEDKSRYSRFLMATPRLLLPARDPLDGALALMLARLNERMAIAA